MNSTSASKFPVWSLMSRGSNLYFWTKRVTKNTPQISGEEVNRRRRRSGVGQRRSAGQRTDARRTHPGRSDRTPLNHHSLRRNQVLTQCFEEPLEDADLRADLRAVLGICDPARPLVALDHVERGDDVRAGLDRARHGVEVMMLGDIRALAVE